MDVVSFSEDAIEDVGKSRCKFHARGSSANLFEHLTPANEKMLCSRTISMYCSSVAKHALIWNVYI